MSRSRAGMRALALECLGTSAAGALLALAFGGGPCLILAYCAPIVWLYVVGRPATRPLRAMLVLGLGQLVFFACAGAWMVRQFGVAAHAVTWSYVTLLVLPLGALVAWQRRHLGWPMVAIAPPLWVAFEFFRARVPLGHPGVYLLGYSQADWLPAVQSAELWGVWGVSFLVVLVAAAVTDLLLADPTTRRVRIGGVVASLALVGLSAGLGSARMTSLALERGPRVALVQPVGLRSAGLPLHNQLLLAQLVNLTYDQIEPGDVDLVAWPENSVVDFVVGRPEYEEDIQASAGWAGADLLVSALGGSERPQDGYTSTVFQYRPDGSIAGRHDKTILIPGTEYVPFVRQLSAVSPTLERKWRELVTLVSGVRASGRAGRVVTVLRVSPRSGGSLAFATPTCFENTHSAVARSAVHQGARFLVNMTSEGRIGQNASEHVLRIAVFRAIENRVPIARAGNVGITAFIDPLGRVRSRIETTGDGKPQAAVLTDSVMLASTGPTIHVRFGDWFAWACVLFATLSTLLAVRRARTTGRHEE